METSTPTIPATVWSKETCGFCTLAIAELRQRKYDVTVKKLVEPSTSFKAAEKMYTKEELLKEVPDAKSVPQIFIGEEYIGGYSDLMKHFSK